MREITKEATKEYLMQIKHSPLFAGMNEEEIAHILECQNTHIASYEKESYIFREGQNIYSFGMVLSGSVHMVKDDLWGNRSILAKMTAGQIFGQSVCFMDGEALAFSVVAAEKTVVMFLDSRETLTVCSKTCFSHNHLIHNLVQVMAEANQVLMRKIEHTSQRTTRDKILSYLSDESRRQKSLTFEIPFNRQQLAEYLNVDRSAMSATLGKLKKEGILTFDKNKFTILS